MSEKTIRYTVEDILPYLGAHKILGNAAGKYFSRLRVVTDADEESLVWISPARIDKQTLAEQTAAGIVVCDDSIQVSPSLEQEKCFVLVPDPKWSFARIANALFAPEIEFGVHPTAYVHAEAQIHDRTYIGPFSYIGKSSIGEGTVLSGHCHVYDNIQIGKNVRIHAGTVIGADGFGYLTGEDGRQVNFPHVGGVVIEDDVEIGANTCIDRGALGNTHIKQGAKIDNLVHIAHNVVVGKHAMVIAHALVGGSTIIGDGSWVAPSAVLRDGLVVGSYATVGLGAVLTKDVPDNETWTGVPARPLSQFLDLQKKLKQL